MPETEVLFIANKELTDEEVEKLKDKIKSFYQEGYRLEDAIYLQGVGTLLVFSKEYF